MPSFKMSVPHKLSQDEAQRRIQGMLGDLKQQYGEQISNLEESWSGATGAFAMTAMGMKISGTLAVRPTEVALDGSIPFAAVPFKGQIEKLIRQEAERLLA